VIKINLIKMLNSSKMSAFMLSSKYSCNPAKQVNRVKQVSNKITHVRAASYMSSSFKMNKLPFYQHAMNPAANGFVQKRQFSLPSHIKLEMPNLSPTMEKGNIGTWEVKVGDQIAPGDVLCSIETDKATIDYEM